MNAKRLDEIEKSWPFHASGDGVFMAPPAEVAMQQVRELLDAVANYKEEWREAAEHRDQLRDQVMALIDSKEEDRAQLTTTYKNILKDRLTRFRERAAEMVRQALVYDHPHLTLEKLAEKIEAIDLERL